MHDYDAYLRYCARKYVKSEDDIEDYMQEGRIEIWKEIQRGYADKRWLLVCARNRMANLRVSEMAQKRGGIGDMRRENYSDNRKMIDGGLISTDEIAAHAELTYDSYSDVDIRRVVRTLPDSQREYVWLRFWHDWSYDQLNAHFGTANSSSRWARIRTRLRDTLSDDRARG